MDAKRENKPDLCCKPLSRGFCTRPKNHDGAHKHQECSERLGVAICTRPFGHPGMHGNT